MMRPNLGFAAGEAERRYAPAKSSETLTGKIERAGVEAARRKFTPEFINRLDKTVVFRPLGEPELRQDPGHRAEPGAAAHFQLGQRRRRSSSR